MNKIELRNATGITSTTLAKLGKNQNVSMEVLGRICKELECDIGDIVKMRSNREGQVQVLSEVRNKAFVLK